MLIAVDDSLIMCYAVVDAGTNTFTVNSFGVIALSVTPPDRGSIGRLV